MTTTRTPGLRGRKAIKPPEERYAIAFMHEYTSLPAPKYPIDVSGGVVECGMLANGPDPTLTPPRKPVGDCTFAGRQHLRMMKAAREKATETWETSDQLYDEYMAYDHNRDEGANIADLLMAWYKAGKILAFAPIDISKREYLDAATQTFGGAYCGVELTDNADQLFSEGKPWVAGVPDPDEGHCIVLAEITKTRDGYRTWGNRQWATKGWTKRCLTEAWAVVTSEDSMSPGELAALRVDIDAAGGTGGTPAKASVTINDGRLGGGGGGALRRASEREGANGALPYDQDADRADLALPLPKLSAAWSHILTVLFTCIAALPAAIPIIAYAFGLSAAQSAGIASVVGGIVTAAAALHQFLVNNKVIVSAARKAKAVFTK